MRSNCLGQLLGADGFFLSGGHLSEKKRDLSIPSFVFVKKWKPSRKIQHLYAFLASPKLLSSNLLFEPTSKFSYPTPQTSHPSSPTTMPGPTLQGPPTSRETRTLGSIRPFSAQLVRGGMYELCIGLHYLLLVRGFNWQRSTV